MHVRVRTFGKPDTIVVVESKLTKIDQFRKIVKEKFNVNPKLQRLFYGGKLLENGYTFHDYNIKINDVIQLVVHVEPQELKKDIKSAKDKKSTDTKNEDNYTDAESVLYQIGDLIDVRSQEEGAWFEGKIVRIVFDPTVDTPNNIKENIQETTNDVADKCDSKNNLKDKPPSNVSASGSCKSKEKGIVKYLCKSPKIVKKKSCDDDNQSRTTDVGLWYKVQLDSGENEPNPYCLLKDIRPRARHVIDPKDLKVGQKIMVNHNTEDPFEKGYWYDFKIDKINKLRSVYELVGTLYSGSEVVPQNDTIVRVLDKIYTIDEVVPLAKRSKEYKKMMITQPDKRSQPVNCLTCRDDPNTPCKDCGCCLCSGKDFPDKIVMCDECNGGYHMICLTPPMTELPEEDWYCPSCKRDNTSVIVPGGAKQAKKTNTSKSNRDWGRGMACAGKTKTCAMPANHFGPIPGIEVGMCWRFRIQLSETGVHRPPVSGIHGRDVEGAYSIVLSGGYEDDVDNGNEFTYTGSGGRDLSGNKRTAEQSCDQTLTRENKALARNCAVKEIKEAGGNAGNNWRNGKPVRVVRSYKMMKHFPKYAPKEGIRYDGIYKVVKYYPEKGLSGYIVWKYLLRRDDPNRAPWEPGAKQYPIIYPDGYLEAEAEKKALKEKSRKTPKVTKKRALRKINESTTSEDEPSPPVKKRKIIEKKAGKLESKNSTITKSPKAKISNMFTKNSPKAKDSKSAQDSTTETSGLLTTEEMNAIKADTLNSKLWDECLIVNEARGKREFIEYITQMFLCIICQEVAATPVTTPCLHNFCLSCIKGAFKTTSKNCPCCRHDLSRYEPEPNEKLTTALRSVLTGYDVGRSKSEWRGIDLATTSKAVC
ncbi:E3 ubiquitin-protein ligase UHRF1-like [Achroia grisella]|uniref:E3 ubiquitin-protein ligase UHRF1-like n=1 Tax=Achroia grisella TaxID=688607 RepID=UPI0027D34F72|nr:E3 ubiquitin-protein ligase UHRF1-like [Achroia grisella]